MMHQRARDPRPRRFDPTLLLAFLLPVFAWAPLTYPGYFVFRSGFLPIFNVADRLARLGDLAWMPVVGKSYSLLGGDGPLPYLLGALAAGVGVSPTNAVKWVFGLSFVAGSVGAYLWTRRMLPGGWPALVGATIYVFNPISLRLVYTDGAYAQAVLLALVPWVLWGADAALGGALGTVVASALLMAAALWTLVGTALLFLLAVLVYLLVLRQSRRVPARGLAVALGGLAGGLLLGAVGLLPGILRSGAGVVGWPASGWLVLLTPGIALLGGWVAGRLGEMLPEQETSTAPALFAALIALPLLLGYGDVQPVATPATIPSAPLAIFGENEIALLSVKTEGTPGPSGSVAVEVEWQALRPLTRDYTVFFHVIAPNEQRYGQLDTMPQGGKLATTQWQPGEVVRDRYEARLLADAPISSDYRYWLGWYSGATGERLAVREGISPAPGDKYVVKP